MPRDQDRVFAKNPFRHYRKTYDLTEARVGAVVLLGLAAILAWVIYAGQHPDPRLLALDVVDPGENGKAAGPVDRGPLPEDLVLEGWLERPVRVFGPKSLYEKINGREGYYKSFGFERLYFVTLERSGEPTTLVDLELFDLGTPANALGAYNGERDEATSPEVGARGLAHFARNALYLTRGRFYLRAVGSSESEAVIAALEKVRARFEQDLAGEPLPWSYALFLGKLELPPDAIAYYAKNAFGFSDFATEVHAGRLADETELFVKATASPEAAAEIARAFDEGFASYGEVKAEGFVEDRYIQTVSKASAQDAWVYGVRGAPDLAAAKASMARLGRALAGFPAPAVERTAPGEGGANPSAEPGGGEAAYDSVEAGER